MQRIYILFIIATFGKTLAADAPFLSPLQVLSTNQPELETETEIAPFVSADILTNAPINQNLRARPMIPSAPYSAASARVPEPEIKFVDAPSKPQIPITGIYPQAPYPAASASYPPSVQEPEIKFVDAPSKPQMPITGIYPPAIPLPVLTGPYPAAIGAPTKQANENMPPKVKLVTSAQNNDLPVLQMKCNLVQSGKYPPAVLPPTDTVVFPEDIEDSLSNDEE